MDSERLKKWFCNEVLPLEPSLVAFIRRSWRNPDDVYDIRQDVYAKVLEIGSNAPLRNTKAYVFTTAKNIMINRARRANVVQIELIADIEAFYDLQDWITPDRHLEGRASLKRLLEAVESLPPRCREVIKLRKIEGLSTHEVAGRLGLGIDAVQQHTMLGMRAVADFMGGGEGRVYRPKRSRMRSRAKSL
jgi:RNA polymerase sigma factor (sigma-70 family)